jgi:hypothetical protein
MRSLSIKTIYDGNKTSHFHPVRDSFRIYKTPLLYLIVALLSGRDRSRLLHPLYLDWPER